MLKCMERFVIVLSPDELEPPKVGFNDEIIDIPTVEESNDTPVDRYVLKYRVVMKLLFEFGGIPTISVCALSVYTKSEYTFLSLDIFNLIVFIVCCFKLRQKRTVDTLPNTGLYEESCWFILSAAWIQIMASVVCLTTYKFLTMSVSFYQYVTIQLLLVTQYAVEVRDAAS